MPGHEHFCDVCEEEIYERTGDHFQAIDGAWQPCWRGSPCLLGAAALCAKHSAGEWEVPEREEHRHQPEHQNDDEDHLDHGHDPRVEPEDPREFQDRPVEDAEDDERDHEREEQTQHDDTSTGDE